MASRSFLLANALADFAARRSRIFSAISRSAGSSEASGSGTTRSVAVAGLVLARAALAAGDSLADAVGAEDVSVEACCDVPVGPRFLPCANTLNTTARIKAKAVPARKYSRRGPLIISFASSRNLGDTVE